MQPLKIEMVHDIVCSWCPIGYVNLQRALRNLKLKADIRFLPYELNPSMAAEGEESDAHLARRYRWDGEKRREYRRHLLQTADAAGICIDFSRRRHYYNSNKAHRLLHWSEGFGKQQALNEALIRAYFQSGLDISNTHVLLALAEQTGLDCRRAQQALRSNHNDRPWQQKIRRVRQLAVPSVPAFVINDDTLLQGSRSVAFFEQAIRELTTHQSLTHKEQP